jgi:hypothetical protein
MKLRLRKNSLRLRLSQGEVVLFNDSGVVEEYVDFGEGIRFFYRMVSENNAVQTAARLEAAGITVVVPSSEAQAWAATEQIGISAEQAIPDGLLNILIEKDFTCLEPRASGEDDDTFPNPSGCGE